MVLHGLAMLSSAEKCFEQFFAKFRFFPPRFRVFLPNFRVKMPRREMMSEHKKHLEIKRPTSIYINLPSFADFWVKVANGIQNSHDTML